MKIYTRTGDDGTTGLIGGLRVEKDSPMIELVGALDELNTALGHVRVMTSDSPLDFLLTRLQAIVFEIGAEVSSPHEHRQSHTARLGSIVESLERSIDMQWQLLPDLKNFVLPGGCELASRLHWARCLCRRAERQIVLFARDSSVRPELLAVLNRLSDWLFVAARSANHDLGFDEPVWSKED